MTGAADGRPPVCGARAYLPEALVPLALRLETRADRATERDVERHLRCTLESHEAGPHWELVMDLDGPDTGSVWTYWADGSAPESVVVLPDCPGADGQPCTEYARHPGGHSPELHDPWSDWHERLVSG
ncbi:hypothetical protein [Streptomyces sp.]|uniref:hypothetical protein n=1 Tax=Streptomyces sp. TaxID=1931 RepID=UPI002F412B1C